MGEIIFHIGMGKTGTSSIQACLSQNRQALLENFGFNYLGMGFDIISPKYGGYQGPTDFLSLPPEEIRRQADVFYDSTMERCSSKADRFLISNEAIYGYPDNFSQFCNRLSNFCKVKIICYARNPYDWLPSAYVQWAILHKANSGPIISFEEYAQKSIGSYAALVRWKMLSTGYHFYLRPHMKGVNVLDDFAKVCSIELERRPQRVLERIDPVEIAFRSAFNSHFDKEVLPNEFDEAFRESFLKKRFSLSSLLSRSLDYSSADVIINEYQYIFDGIKNELGVDLLDSRAQPHIPPEIEELRNGIVDILVQQVTWQARSIKALEDRIKLLETAIGQSQSSC